MEGLLDLSDHISDQISVGENLQLTKMQNVDKYSILSISIKKFPEFLLNENTAALMKQ